MARTRTCGEALVELLGRYGVDTVFGIPGVHTLDLYRGIAAAGMAHVQARHEQGAGFMADGYARVSGRPGVCVLISGPGVTNGATALGQAFADSSPVLMISSVTASHTLGKGWGCLHEVADQRAVTAPLTAFSALALSPDELPELLGQAFGVFASARPRPVHISVPIDVLAATVQGEWAARTPPSRPAPDPEAIAAAAALLAGARRPVVCVGGGAADAGHAVTALVERLDATLIASTAGKGIVPDDHPLSLGASTVLAPTRAHLAEADVVLAVGTELGETDSFVERMDIPGRIVRVDIDPAKINDLYPAAIGIHADAGPASRALLAALGPGEPGARGAAARAAAVRERNLAAMSPTERGHAAVLAALRSAAPEGCVVMGDITQLVYTGAFAYPVREPRRWFYPAGYCTLGCGLPMAIGARLAEPERPVMVIAGDGGFMFTVQELAAAAELGLSLPIVLWNNDGLGQIRDDMNARQIPLVGVEGRNPDFQALARAFGCRAERAEDPDALSRAVAGAFEADAPTLIEVRQDAGWAG